MTVMSIPYLIFIQHLLMCYHSDHSCYRGFQFYL